MNLAHLSDVHVKWVPGQAGPWYLFLGKRLVGGLNLLLGRSHSEAIFEAALADLRADPPDHLALTGDLTNLSLDAEFEEARRLLSASELPAEKISLIPGNHDTYTRGSYRARRFEKTFEEVLGPDVSWPRAQQRDDVLVVSTTSCVPTPWFTAYGKMGAAQLARLRELLTRDAAFKVVLVHHPPLLGNGQPDRIWRNNHDGAALVEICRDAGVGLLLCGHTHHAFDHTVEGTGGTPLRIYCAGSTTKPPKVLGDAATYNRYRIEDGALRSVEVRGFDPKTQAFAVIETRELGTSTHG